MKREYRLILVTGLALSALPSVTVGQGSGPGAGNPPAPAAKPQQQSVPTGQIDQRWLAYDPGTRTVTFRLIAGMTGGAKSPYNFNGFTDGEMTLVVPEGATVVMHFENQDGTPHSAEVIGDGPMPNLGIDPAIPRAYTKQLTMGIAQGGTDVMKFKAAPAGRYRIFCGFPGHGISGMWIWFEVRKDATEPSMYRGMDQ
ncbi:MAG TPA: sulfocyanin-like copper-binding protein [Gemmatimonadales bacterium]|jgi:sulfocyanin|nr:sulfocyanin-like copper-binding protein [Gemmatimonadales bacterium]